MMVTSELFNESIEGLNFSSLIVKNEGQQDRGTVNNVAITISHRTKCFHLSINSWFVLSIYCSKMILMMSQTDIVV